MFSRALFVLLFISIAAFGENADFPAKDWKRAEKAEPYGFSTRRLATLTPYLQTLDTSAMMVIAGGRVVFEYGDVKKVSYLASCRKSVLAMLYGKYVKSGQIPLNKTLREMEFTDVGGLLPKELDATVEDLITARSGVYHPASNGGDASDSAPPRGSQIHGTYQLYNNWDFNAAGAAFEKLTGKDIYDALQQDLAEPIGMQDFDRAAHAKSGDPARSIHMAYHMNFSTRDMGRLGYLMLREGNWNGQQLVPRDWTHKITSLVTPIYEINPPSWREYGKGSVWGYGYMWWVWDDHHRQGPFAGAYSARGAIGQFITVLPAMDVVVVHKTIPGEDSGRVRNVSDVEYQTILMHVAAAYCGKNCRE
ncbi:MAG: serine hydrolase [Bryobacteraceae bacterium]